MAYSSSNNRFPYFKAGINSNVGLNSNYGEGSANGVPFNQIDISGSIGTYSTVTNEYTVPVKGLYMFTVNINMKNNGYPNDDSLEWGFNVTKQGAYTYYRTVIDPGFWTSVSHSESMIFTKIIQMNVDDRIKVFFAGKTDEETYLGSVNNLGYNFFYGFLISAGFS